MFEETFKMPLPNYGYYNKEAKKHQELVFQMAPEIVDDPDDVVDFRGQSVGRKETQSRKKGKVITGKLGIDLERKLVLHQEKDAHVWKPPSIDKQEVEEAKKYAAPERKNFRREVRSGIDSLISGNKLKQIQDTGPRKPTDLVDSFPTSNQRKPVNPYGGHETVTTGVSIQPSGIFKLDNSGRRSKSPKPKTSLGRNEGILSSRPSASSSSTSHYKHSSSVVSSSSRTISSGSYRY